MKGERERKKAATTSSRQKWQTQLPAEHSFFHLQGLLRKFGDKEPNRYFILRQSGVTGVGLAYWVLHGELLPLAKGVSSPANDNWVYIISQQGLATLLTKMVARFVKCESLHMVYESIQAHTFQTLQSLLFRAATFEDLNFKLKRCLCRPEWRKCRISYNSWE